MRDEQTVNRAREACKIMERVNVDTYLGDEMTFRRRMGFQ
jgi:hypothetical protein